MLMEFPSSFKAFFRRRLHLQFPAVPRKSCLLVLQEKKEVSIANMYKQTHTHTHAATYHHAMLQSVPHTLDILIACVLSSIIDGFASFSQFCKGEIGSFQMRWTFYRWGHLVVVQGATKNFFFASYTNFYWADLLTEGKWKKRFRERQKEVKEEWLTDQGMTWFKLGAGTKTTAFTSRLV